MPDTVATPPQPEFLNPHEAAAILRFRNTKTLERMARRGTGPPRVKLSAKTILYNRAQLIEWMLARATVGDPHPKKKKRGRPVKAKRAAVRQ